MLNMVEIKCPRCKGPVEISEFKNEEEHRIGVFCKENKCAFHKSPIIGLDRKRDEAYISETLI